jgi:hypothetical protein
MPTEREWVASLEPQIQEALQRCGNGEWRVEVCTGARLAYANQIMRYDGNDVPDYSTSKYETDLLTGFRALLSSAS